MIDDPQAELAPRSRCLRRQALKNNPAPEMCPSALPGTSPALETLGAEWVMGVLGQQSSRVGSQATDAAEASLTSPVAASLQVFN